jgi:hypothetical protein
MSVIGCGADMRTNAKSVANDPFQTCGATDMVTTMRRGLARISCAQKLLWRRVVVVGLCYAFIIQSLLLGFVGSQIAANLDVGTPGYALCLGDGGEHEPADTPERHTISHCIFCFAASHGFAVAPSQVASEAWIAVSGKAQSSLVASLPWQSTQFNIARPRGPPINT